MGVRQSLSDDWQPGSFVGHASDAHVEHFIRDFQMTREWILGRAFRFGRGVYRIRRTEGQADFPSWFGVPRYLFRELLKQAALLSKGLLTFRAETVFRARWELSVLRGQITEAYRSRRAPSEQVR